MWADVEAEKNIRMRKRDKRDFMSQVIVVGGGAAGMMASYAAASAGHQVVLLEKNEKLGKKIYITGKGRCNVTNAADKEQFFQNIVTNSKFLYSSIYQFDHQSMVSFLEEYGCPVKTERGGRIFPISDHASDVTAALQRALKEMYVDIHLKTEVKALLFTENADGKKDAGNQADKGKTDENRGAGDQPDQERATKITDRQIEGVLLANGKKMEADAVILACGGVSYPSTGSDGAGYKLAAMAGHSLVPCYPALAPLEIKEHWCRKLQGLSLKNVEVKLMQEGKDKPLFSGFGEMLFTHFGVSGPLILSASSYYSRALKAPKRGVSVSGDICHGEEDQMSEKGDMCAKLVLNLKPAMDMEMLDKRLLRDFEENSHKSFKNALGGLFPSKLIPVMVELSGIDGEKKVYDVTREERRSFVSLIQHLTLTVTGTRGFEEAIITQGGIPVSEVNPSSMESRLCRGLYFAGEMLDIDALTGGYNLQLAWSTGHLAGASVRF